ncbi:MAG TPA: hypothetical protein PKI61_00435 [bacterium]|nr:hypothetical protein [bacterium]HPT29508.1 hypothetical protein [bacterium]
MNRRYIIWLIIAIIVIAAIITAFFIFSRRQTNQNQNQTPAGQTMSYEDRLSTIQKLFAKQSGQSLDKVDVKVARENSQFIKGIVTITDKYEGIFFAAKQNGEWQIIWNGEKKYTCADLAQYKLPAEMINDCQ